MLLFCPLVMMASQSSLPFACSAVPSVNCSHIFDSVCLASDSELTSDFCLQMLYFLIVGLKSQFTQHLVYVVAPDRLD